MIVFTKEQIAANANHAAQFGRTMGERRIARHNQTLIVNQYGEHLDAEDLTKNAADQFGIKFWAEIDRRAIEVRNNDMGRELMTDLMTLATPLDIGKTVKTYARNGDIQDEVKISMDGQTPVTFDHVDRDSEGDPVPIFQAGFGINWREWQGRMSENIDTLADSQSAKMKVVLSRMADYLLDGDAKIRVAGFSGQGIRNHRNTKKINLTTAGVAGAPIDLTAAATSNDAILNFWNQTFALQLDANYVNGKLSVVWVSPEIMRRMTVPFSAADGFKSGSLLTAVLEFGRVGEFKQTYKLSGNQFLGYMRDKDAISPLVGQAVSTTPIARLQPRDNYNFEIWSALGLQIKADANGRGSVFYAANLT
jgi:hypothetical protein